MRLFRSLLDIIGHGILFVDDCLPVVLAMQKGSQSLRVKLQADSGHMATAGLESGATLVYLDIPETRMIEDVVSGASRDQAYREPSCPPRTRATVNNEWRVSVQARLDQRTATRWCLASHRGLTSQIARSWTPLSQLLE